MLSEIIIQLTLGTHAGEEDRDSMSLVCKILMMVLLVLNTLSSYFPISWSEFSSHLQLINAHLFNTLT